jgi:deoxyxylulose-5-phosphate synthase
VGIILLEYLKPYDKLAREVEKLMTAGIKAAVFLEEEIRKGGAGMLLSDKMLANGALDGVEYAVMATDDDFVWQKSGKSIYESAGVSASDIVDNIRSLAECGSLKM